MLFFALFFVYFAFEIDVRLLYHCCGLIDNFPSFYRGWDFFRGFLGYPGGIAAYLSAFLAQSFYYAWLGAATVTLQAWAICWCTDYTIRAFGGRRWRALRFVGPLLLLAVYSQYVFHFPTTIGFLIALAGFCLYVRLTPGNTTPAIAFYLLMSVVLYVVVGGPYLLFALLCGLYELLPRRRLQVALACLVVATALPYVVGNLIYRVRPHDAYLELSPLSWKVIRYSTAQIMIEAVYVLYLFVPLTVLGLGLWRLVFAREAGSSKTGPKLGKRKPSSAKSSRIRALLAGVGEDRSHGRLGLNLPTLALIVATAVTLLLYRDASLKQIYRVDYFARQKMWNRVLEVGRRCPYHYLICHAVDLALFHTNQLGERMFEFPQDPTALFLTRKGTEALWQKVDTCMDIGLLNQSENAATICLETFGERPLLLERLATINMAKGNVSTARVFLRALAKVPFWGSTARDKLAGLDEDPNCTQDAEIQHLRRIMLKTDFVRDADTLILLLTENPNNRMAYEYGLASLLLSRNLDGFVTMFAKYYPSGAGPLPRHYHEALLLARAIKRQPLDSDGLQFSKESRLELHEFLQALQQGRKDKGMTKEQLQSALKDRYGTTYYYYFFLGS